MRKSCSAGAGLRGRSCGLLLYGSTFFPAARGLAPSQRDGWAPSKISKPARASAERPSATSDD